MGDGLLSDPREAVEAVFRQEHASLLAALIRRARGDFELAEEALAEALVIALDRWPVEGEPERPAAWIYSVGLRRLIDAQRRLRHRDAAHLDLEAEARQRTQEEDPMDTEDIADDRLRLIFTCCHPALEHSARVALTLNTLGGLRASEIARSFLIREVTMSQRLVRAKRKIRDAGIPFRVPAEEEWPRRLPAVLEVLYLIFNEGYAAAGGTELLRQDLCQEALRLARILMELVPDEPEVQGLFALMRLQDSRRLARVSIDGELVLLEDQDRSLWDHGAITEGIATVERALARARPGPYQIEAAIAAVHAETVDGSRTDWPQIVCLYDALLRFRHTPVARLNRAVALAMARGWDAGLEEIDALLREGGLDSFLYLHSSRADLLRRAGRMDEARTAYLRAIDLADNAAERRFLTRRLDEVELARPDS